MELSLLDIVVGIIITWGWGLSIPLILRYAIFKRPIDKTMAALIAGGLWLVNLTLFTMLGSKSRTHAALFLVAWVSYWILTRTQTTPHPDQLIQQESNAIDDAGNARPRRTASSEVGITENNARPLDLRIDNGFKGKRIKIFLVATVISFGIMGALISYEPGDIWVIIIPALSTLFSTISVGTPESTQNWPATIAWSLLLTLPAMATSYIALAVIVSIL